MNAGDLYKAGKLQDAIDAQIKEVRASPGDQARRLFLFELLAFAGDLDRAQKQVEAVKYTELELEAATLAYRKLLDTERLRRRLFSEGLAPKFLQEPPAHLHHRLEAVNALRQGRRAEAAELLQKAGDASPQVQGSLNDKPFTALRDCDDLCAGILEVMTKGIYYWVPWEHIASVSMNAPRFPRDLLWAPARLEMRGGDAGDVFLPVLYHGSHAHADDQVKLGRMTDWQGEEGGGPVLGLGLRTYLVDDDPSTLLEWRQLQFA